MLGLGKSVKEILAGNRIEESRKFGGIGSCGSGVWLARSLVFLGLSLLGVLGFRRNSFRILHLLLIGLLGS